MNANWHPGCFRCEECNGELADAGFIKCQGRALCHTCNARVKAGALGKHICHQCQYGFYLFYFYILILKININVQFIFQIVALSMINRCVFVAKFTTHIILIAQHAE